MTVLGLNHITLAVADVQRSLTFYQNILGFRVRAIWAEGAYLEAGSLWLCLSRDDQVRQAPYADYTHMAFSVSEDAFAGMSETLMSNSVIWKENRSEGYSVYFLDPDGHKLEIHVGSLESRLQHYLNTPSKNVQVL
ncbi:fosfomycin resistance glutathione transferase [Gluconobacter oxydans]|uniref:fosfomycin resistance glutathione transferase n=1 Tax=Gluconobacter oxydans TaxID=442 RepID=UPI001CD9080B|nr:fosfomycin resistance glutathione transferase [Gluconobacter oxydans]